MTSMRSSVALAITFLASLSSLAEVGDKSWACLLPPRMGPCQVGRQMYFYDRKKGRCTPFYYSGCGGNENRFDTREECIATCLSEVSS